MKTASQKLDKEISLLQNELSTLPEGNLVCRNLPTRTRWFYRDDNSSEYKCIPKSNREFAEKLARKRCLSLQLTNAAAEKKAIDSYLHLHTEKYTEKLQKLLSQPAYQELLSSDYRSRLAKNQNLSEKIQSWANAPFEQNTAYPENLIYHTGSGFPVRSKSEAFIEMALRTQNIPFRYECKLILGNQTVYPDFTICHPLSGKIYYWEHFGMIDNPAYLKSALAKIKLYCEHSIYPGETLILTFETSQNPLSPDTVEQTVKTFFL